MKEILNFRHVGLVTPNIDRSLNFYLKILNFKLIKKKIENRKLIKKLLRVKDGNLTTYKIGLNKKIILELLDFKIKRKNLNLKLNDNGLTHISLTVKNIENLKRRIKKNKISFNSKILRSDDKKVKLVFCKTPENIYLELVQINK